MSGRKEFRLNIFHSDVLWLSFNFTDKLTDPDIANAWYLMGPILSLNPKIVTPVWG
jgi:hypothetical protein